MEVQEVHKMQGVQESACKGGARGVKEEDREKDGEEDGEEEGEEMEK